MHSGCGELEEFPQEYQEATQIFRRDLDALGICEQQYPQGDRQAGGNTLPYYVTAGKDENCGRADFL